MRLALFDMQKPTLIRHTSIACALLAALGFAGCAYTSIEKSADGSFRYYSTRDSAIEEMHIARAADGTLELDVNGASGRSSPVIDAQTELLRAAIEAALAAASRAAAGN